MRKAILLLASMFALVAMTAAEPTATVLKYYGESEILVPQADKDRLRLYERLCLEQLVPQIIGELRKKHPMVEPTIDVDRDDVKSTIEIRLGTGDEKTAVEYAKKMAEMAVRRIVAADEAERRGMIEPIKQRADELETEIRHREDQLGALRRQAGVYGSVKDIELLVASLNSYREQLVQAELKEAELETKLNVLAKKAAEVKDTVSTEQIAMLEKMAQQLETQIQEQSSEDALKKYQIILRQKEQELERVMGLQKSAAVSVAEAQKAQDEFELARVDYERAKRMMSELRNRLERVRLDLARAKEKLAETGGFELATIIAQKTLECETEMVANKIRMQELKKKIRELEEEIPEKRAVTSELERRQAQVDVLKKSLDALHEEERRLERLMPVRQPEILRVEWTGTVALKRPQQDFYYDVAGEVRSPLGVTTGVTGEVSLLKAIETAGGFTDNADLANVVLIRRAEGSSEKHVIDCKAILEKRAPDRLIHDRDLIWVPAKETAEVERVEEPVEPKPEELITLEMKGEVKNPGSKQLRGWTGLVEAIEQWGGFTDNADVRHVTVIRTADDCIVEHIMDYNALKRRGRPGDFHLRTGDVVRVPRKKAATAKPLPPEKQVGTHDVLGEAKNPGSYSLGPKTTVLKAIASAGGFSDYADSRRTVVIRRRDGSTQRYYIDCDAILKGRAPDDFMILPGDTIWVPRKGAF